MTFKLSLFLILGLLVSCHSASYGNHGKNSQKILASKQKAEQLIEKQPEVKILLSHKEHSTTEEPQQKSEQQEDLKIQTSEESQIKSDPLQIVDPQQESEPEESDQQHSTETQTIKQSQPKDELLQTQEPKLKIKQQSNDNPTTKQSQPKDEPSQTEEPQLKINQQQSNDNPTTEQSQLKDEPSQTEEPQLKINQQQSNDNPTTKQSQPKDELLQAEVLQQQNEQQPNENQTTGESQSKNEPSQTEELQQQNEEAQLKVEIPQEKHKTNLELQAEEPIAEELKPKIEAVPERIKLEQSQNALLSGLQQKKQIDKKDFQLSKHYNFKPVKAIYKSPNLKVLPKLPKYVQPSIEQYSESLTETNVWSMPLPEEPAEPILQRQKRPKLPNFVKPTYRKSPAFNQQPMYPIHSEIHPNEIPGACAYTYRDGSNPINTHNYGGHLTSYGDAPNIRQMFDSYVEIQPAYSDIGRPIKEFVYDELPYIYQPENYYQH